MLGALTAPAQRIRGHYNSVTPRVGLTYALTESRKTIARASYAIFASQLDSHTRGIVVSQIPRTSTGSGYVYWLATDLNGNGITDPNELALTVPRHGRLRSRPIRSAATRTALATIRCR